jgi:hypothetical protein
MEYSPQLQLVSGKGRFTMSTTTIQIVAGVLAIIVLIVLVQRRRTRVK